MSKVGLLGSGGQADEIESFLADDIIVDFKAVSPEYLSPKKSKQIDISGELNGKEKLPIIIAVGAPGLKRKLSEIWPGNQYYTLIARQAFVSPSAKVGKGSVVSPMASVTTNVHIGQHVLINLGASVSHDAKIGDFSTVSPGAHIAGRVTIGRGVFIGIGAVISNDVKIADGSVIGAGAVVIDNIDVPNSVAVGIPAKTIKVNDDWLQQF